MQTKNTRLVYVDEKNLKVYQSLPNEDFKEFFMTFLTYQEGDDVSKTISNPLVQTLFMAAYADKIAYNEEKWEKKAKAARENGKKGGRKPKNSPNEAIEPQNDIVVPQEEESVPEGLKQGEFDNSIEEFETDTNNDTPINTNDDMGMLIGTLKGYREFSVEARSEQPKFDASKFINWLKENNQCLYTKVIRTPSKSLSTNDNMRRMKESLDGQLRDYIKDETTRQQFYIYIIDNNN